MTRELRVARNHALFREVNERISEISGSTPAAHELLCECADESCVEPIVISGPEYESIRRLPTRFLVRPGHIVPGVERVVENGDGYAVVEKFGDDGTLTVRLDPRRRSRSDLERAVG